jgi:intracellular multiplication protein IcmL
MKKNKLIQSEDLILSHHFTKNPKDFNDHIKYFKYIYISFLVNALLIGTFIIGTIYPHNVKFFTINEKGVAENITGLNSPILSDTEVADWTTNALIKSLTFSFTNYNDVKESSREYYTTSGWNSFLAALDSSKIIDSVVNYKYIINSVATNIPILISKGKFSGKDAWVFQIPITITFTSTGDSKSTKNYIIDTIVLREPQHSHPDGLGIEQFKED